MEALAGRIPAGGVHLIGTLQKNKAGMRSGPSAYTRLTASGCGRLTAGGKARAGPEGIDEVNIAARPASTVLRRRRRRPRQKRCRP
jgi:hypothetical protein